MAESRMALSTERVRAQALCSAPSLFHYPRQNHGYAVHPQGVCRLSSLLKEKRAKQLSFSSLGSACFKHGFSLKIHFLGLSLISSTQEQNAMPLHSKAFNHIYSLFEQIYRSSSCNGKKKQVIAKFR